MSIRSFPPLLYRPNIVNSSFQYIVPSPFHHQTNSMSSKHESHGPSETSPLLQQQDQRLDLEDVENGRVPSSSVAAPIDGTPVVPKKMYLIFPAIAIGVILSALDLSITVASYAHIGNELNSLNTISWIATSYLLTLTSFQPLYGKLCDIFGRKACLLFSYAVFGIGCLGCGLAQSMVQLCLARAVTGIGGAGMSSVVSIVLTDLVPLRDRGLWQGYLNVIFVLGMSGGAPLGGIIADTVGWRWSFFGQVPLCVAAFIAVYLVLDLPGGSEDHWAEKLKRVDFLGAISLIVAVVALLVGLDLGSNLGWGHKATIISLASTPVLFALFIYIEMRIAVHPFAPGHVIFSRGLFPSFLLYTGIGAHYSVVFFPPLYFQAVQGYSAATSGTLLLPPLVITVIGSILSGLVVRKTGMQYKATIVTILGLSGIGLGIGMGGTSVLIGIIANASTEDAAIAVACSYLFRSLGSSLNVGISSAVLQQTLRSELFQRLPNGDAARDIEEHVRQNLDYINRLPANLADAVRSSYQTATIYAHIPAVFSLIIALAASFWMREKPLRK